MPEASEFSIKYQGLPPGKLTAVAKRAMRQSHAFAWYAVWIFRITIFVPLILTLTWPSMIATWLNHLWPPVNDTKLLIVLFAYLFILLIAVILFRKWYAKEIRQDINFEQEINFKINSQGVFIDTKEYALNIKWPGVKNLLMDKNGMVIRHGLLFFFIPNQAFNTQQEKNEFYKFMIDHLTDETKANSKKAIAHVLAI